MKFFKHFTDADDGTLNDLMNKHGVEAYGRYWLFTEFCIKGLEKEANETYTEDHMKFSFNERQLREKLRIKSKQLQVFLGTCSELGLFQFTKTEDKFHFSFPKILKFLDRDSKRARGERDSAAARARLEQDKEQDKEKEEEQDKDNGSDPEQILEFLDSLVANSVELTTSLIQSVIERIHDDLYPSRTKEGRREGVQLLLAQMSFISDLRLLFEATKAYRDFCVKGKVQKIYGFKRFADEWPRWIPKQARAAK